ncbi:MAG TPA: DinB family protein [Phycisphaerae bacterium]|nr:DinB family protein [Phycisphaerae bacterium]
MSNPMVEGGMTVLAFSRKALLGMLEDVPEEKWTHQPVTGGNHAAWIIGHIASTDNFFLTAVAGRESKLPAEWNELFGMGSTPTAELERYPAPAELRDKLAALRGDVLEWYGSLDERQAQAPLPEDLKMFAPCVGLLGNSMAWHEGLHTGQLTVVRRSLGIGPKFG